MVAPPVTTLPAPKPAADPIDVIMGGTPYNDDYGFKAPTNLPYYEYFEGHGGHANQHTGIDVTCRIGQPLYSPAAGRVTCAGTGRGPGSWGTGCAAFADTLGRGAGRVELLLDSGVSLILGHASESLVSPGEIVKAGQQVATCGGMNGAHVHVEARVPGPNGYTIVDPRQALRGTTPAPAPDVLPGVTGDDLKRWFGSVDGFSYHPGGPVTELWIAEGKATGQWPALTDVYKRPDKSTVFRFENGWTVLSKAGKTWVARKER